MQDFDLEIQDDKQRDTEHFNGNVTTAGSPVTLTTSTGRPIQLVRIWNPNKGDYINGPTDLLKISWDDGANWSTYPRGTWEIWPGKGSTTAVEGDTIKVDSNVDGVGYEILIVS